MAMTRELIVKESPAVLFAELLLEMENRRVAQLRAAGLAAEEAAAPVAHDATPAGDGHTAPA